MTVDPAERLARARRGDAEALGDIVAEELPRVAGLLRRMLGPRADLEDLVQTTFVEFFRALPGFRGDAALSTFVGGIAVHVAQRAMRPSPWWSRRGPMPDDDGGGHEATTSGPHDPEDAAVAAARRARLERALGRLAPKKRIAFVLWAAEGQTPAEIAELTGASLTAVRSQIFHARRELGELAQADPILREAIADLGAPAEPDDE